MSRQVLPSQPFSETSSHEIIAFARLMRAQALLRRELQSEVLAPHGLTINDFVLPLPEPWPRPMRFFECVEPLGFRRLLRSMIRYSLNSESLTCEVCSTFTVYSTDIR